MNTITRPILFHHNPRHHFPFPRLRTIWFQQRTASKAAQGTKSISTPSNLVNDKRIISRELSLLRPPTITPIHQTPEPFKFKEHGVGPLLAS